MTTCPDGFKRIHLADCTSTNDYLKQNIARFESDFPLLVTADAQTTGRGRENREWLSLQNLGIYATFGFHLADKRHLGLLSITCGVAAIGMLQDWTGREFDLKWPNDILADGKKIAGILCETVINGEKIVCLAGIGVNVNQDSGDFPETLRSRAGSLKLLTGREWPPAAGRDRLAVSMAHWLEKLSHDDRAAIVGRARHLSRSFLGRTVSFHHQGRLTHGTFLDIAANGGLRLGLADGETKMFYSGELD